MWSCLMNYLIRRLFYLLSFAIVSLSAYVGAAAQVQVTETLIDLGELPSGRPAKISLWFPQGQCVGSHQLCLAEFAITDRTLVLSHGAMGAAENYRWIAESLAEAGYIVVGINHYGESWLYGPETQDTHVASRVWQRPLDVSAIYDVLSNRELFQRKINWSNIIALGHSSGGQTVAMLAGIQYDLSKIIEFCKTDAAVNDHSCDYGIRNARSPGDTFLQKFGGIYKDSRIKKLIMIDPTLGYGATLESLAAVNLPTLVVGALHNDFLPWENHGALYTKRIPNVKTHVLSGQEGHFIFIDTCKNELMVMGVPLCRDKAGVDRATTQKNLAPAIVEFVRQDNIIIDAAKRISVPKKSTFTVDKIVQILMYTPSWVFGLLAGLIILGLVQVRSRKVPLKVVFIMPIAMMLMSVTGTLMNLGFNWITVSSWLAGATVIATFIANRADKPIASYDRAARVLTIQGSWDPLIIILAIFFTRYALGVSTGMNLKIVHDFYFAPVMGLILGSLSGYFVAQGVRYLQLVRQTAKTTATL